MAKRDRSPVYMINSAGREVCFPAYIAEEKLAEGFRRVEQEPAGESPLGAAVSAAVAGLPEPRVVRRPRRERPVLLAFLERIDAQGGGGEMSKAAILAGCAVAGFDVHLAVVADPGDVSLACLKSLRHLPQPDGPLEDLLRELDPDVAVSGAEALETLTPVAGKLGIPVLALVQFWRNILPTCSPEECEHLPRLADRSEIYEHGLRVLAGAAGVMANSSFSAEVVQSALGRPPDVICRPTIDAALFTAAAKRRAKYRGKKVVLLPSGQKAKGAEIFLALAKRFPREKFLILAPRDLPADLPENVSTLEWLDDMPACLARCKAVFVGTQTAESFCRSAAEARAVGVPLLVSDAGHLPMFVGNGGGLVVPKGAPLDEWADAFAQVLKLKPEPDPSWCVNETGRVARLALELAACRRVRLVLGGGPGSREAARQLAACTGAQLGRAGDSLAGSDLVVMVGSVEQGVLRSCLEKGVRVATWWCSHLAQMDTSPEEQQRFLEALHLLKSGHLWRLLVTSEHMPDLEGVVHLPNPFRPAVRPLVPDPARFKVRTVAIVGPARPGKNLWAAAEAVRRFGARLALSPSLAKRGQLVEYCEAIGLETIQLEPTPANLAQCHAGICASLTETFCFGAAELLAAGLPVAGSTLVPALWGDGEVYPIRTAADPTDPGELAKCLEACLAEFSDPGYARHYAAALSCETTSTARSALSAIAQEAVR